MPPKENEVELSELIALEEQIEDLKDALYDARVLLKSAIIIPEGATNGDVVVIMFPDTESRLDERTGIMLVKWEDGTTKTYKASWWNAPFKKEVEE